MVVIPKLRWPMESGDAFREVGPVQVIAVGHLGMESLISMEFGYFVFW
jgi:hypothetical protein